MGFFFEHMQNFVKDTMRPEMVAINRKIESIGQKQGIVTMYHGPVLDGCPTFGKGVANRKFHICDGTSGTINLSDKFDTDHDLYYIEQIRN